MDSAPDYGSGGSRFESGVGRVNIILYIICNSFIQQFKTKTYFLMKLANSSCSSYWSYEPKPALEQIFIKLLFQILILYRVKKVSLKLITN